MDTRFFKIEKSFFLIKHIFLCKILVFRWSVVPICHVTTFQVMGGQTTQRLELVFKNGNLHHPTTWSICGGKIGFVTVYFKRVCGVLYYHWINILENWVISVHEKRKRIGASGKNVHFVFFFDDHLLQSVGSPLSKLMSR